MGKQSGDGFGKGSDERVGKRAGKDANTRESLSQLDKHAKGTR